MMAREQRRLSGGTFSASDGFSNTTRVGARAGSGRPRCLGWRRAMGGRIQGRQERTRIAEGATWATSSIEVCRAAWRKDPGRE